MGVEEATFRRIYRDVEQEANFLDMLIRGSGSVSPPQDKGGGVVHVPPMDITLSQDEIDRHKDTLETINRDIRAVEANAQRQVERIREESAERLAQSKRDWDKAIGEAKSRMRDSEAELRAVSARADAAFARATEALEQLRKADLEQIAATCQEGPSGLREPRPHTHATMPTHLVTRVVLHPRYYQSADVILAWLKASGLQAKHAAGQDFEMTGPQRPKLLEKAPKDALMRLKLELSSRPASQWADLRTAIATILRGANL